MAPPLSTLPPPFQRDPLQPKPAEGRHPRFPVPLNRTRGWAHSLEHTDWGPAFLLLCPTLSPCCPEELLGFQFGAQTDTMPSSSFPPLLLDFYLIQRGGSRELPLMEGVRPRLPEDPRLPRGRSPSPPYRASPARWWRGRDGFLGRAQFRVKSASGSCRRSTTRPSTRPAPGVRDVFRMALGGRGGVSGGP